MTERIQKNKYVSLTYSITDETGDVVESIDLPIHFIHGRDEQVIEKIALALEGHTIGDVVDVELSPAEGFGEFQPELVFTDDLENVPSQFHSIGAEIEFQNDRGEIKVFRVCKIEDGKLTVDGNHPHAGKNITYHITVQDVRDATVDELSNGISYSSRLH